MKYKLINPYKIIKQPELDVNGRIKRFAAVMGKVKPQHWLVLTAGLLILLFAIIPFDIWLNIWLGIKEHDYIVIMVFFFSLIAVSLVWTSCQGLDIWVFKLFNVYGHHSIKMDWLMLGITQLGSGAFGIGTAFLLFLGGNRLLGYELALGTLTLWLVVELLKVLIQRTRPYIKLKGIRIVGSRAGGFSFPSGHTSQSFFMATFLSQYFHLSMTITIILFITALLVGITRLYVGMHYPRDVLGGSILGSAWGFLGIIINNLI